MTFFWDDEDDFQLFDKKGVVVDQIVSFIDEALYKGRRARNDMLENFSLEVIATEIKSQLERIAATAGASLLGEGEL